MIWFTWSVNKANNQKAKSSGGTESHTIPINKSYIGKQQSTCVRSHLLSRYRSSLTSKGGGQYKRRLLGWGYLEVYLSTRQRNGTLVCCILLVTTSEATENGTSQQVIMQSSNQLNRVEHLSIKQTVAGSSPVLLTNLAYDGIKTQRPFSAVRRKSPNT